MKTSNLVLTRPIKGLPAGTRGHGFIGATRAGFVPEGRDSVYFLPRDLVRPLEEDAARPGLVGRLLAIAPALLLQGCLRASGTTYEAGLVDGAAAGVGLVVALMLCSTVVTRWRDERRDLLRIRRAMDGHGPRISDMLEGR